MTELTWAEKMRATQAQVLSTALPAVEERLNKVDPVLTEEQQMVSDQLKADSLTDLSKLQKAITDLAVLLADDTTTGSIRQVIGPTGSVAGTTTLRALRAQSNTAVTSAASIKALIDLNIDLAQRVIDTGRATRTVARQTIRLAKVLVDDYSSSDVGIE